MLPEKRNAAFSLVELSIVLVILGLLVGGVLSGRSLIRAAELRKVTVEYQQWVTAANAFKEKYRALPGDFNKATDFWGTAASCDYGLVYGTLNLSTGSCNGNGDGRVATAVCGTAVSAPCYEIHTFWQHLTKAKLIEGDYSLATYSSAEAGPRSAVGTVWVVANLEGQNGYFADSRRNFFLHSYGLGVGVLPPEEAWGIDAKIDDGRPATGIVTAPVGTALPDCTEKASGAGVTVAADIDAKYKLSVSSNACALMFSY